MRPLLLPIPASNASSTSLAPACTMASILELTCIYLTFILHDNEVIQVRGNKLNGLIKSPSVNVDPFCLNLSEKSLANIKIRVFIWNVGASGSALVLPQQEVLFPPSLLPQLRRKWKQRKKNLRNLMMTWALVFLPHFFCDLFSKKLNSWGEGSRSGRDRIYKRK